jgi:predicted enzyme related to lactoylglutathione lyase
MNSRPFGGLPTDPFPERQGAQPLTSDHAPIATGVDFVAVPCRDFEASVAFYGEVLGLPCIDRYGQMPGAEFQAGNLTLAVMEAERFGATFSPNCLPIALQVPDVEQARARLEARGVSFHGESFDSGVCHQTVFSDPDGNPLVLHHRYAPPKPGGAATP